jgi:CDP-diacylglycerol--serine O-phosphatidyltransferase
VGRVIIVVPSIFTLANLFLGIWAIVLASQGEFYLASWWIVLAGVLDMMDGLFARMSHTGSRFGGELDSLVDLVSFGVAPAVLLYFFLLSSQGPFAWVFSYAFIASVALRLARYNVLHSTTSRRSFTGLPSPAAGMTLATYYPFTLTDFYQTQLAAWPWPQLLIFLMIMLSVGMLSNVQYAKMPRLGFRTVSGMLGLTFYLIILGFGIWARDIFFFPLGIAYFAYGFGRAIVESRLERENGGADEREAGTNDVTVHHLETSRQRREAGDRKPR